MKLLPILALAATPFVAPSARAHDLAQKKSLTLEGARKVIAAAEVYARAHNEGGAIAVVDNGGNLLSLARLDGTFAAGAGIAIGKARTAALFQKTTTAFENLINQGRTAMTALTDFTPLQGGIPIVVDGEIVGAVGVSGAASAAEDEAVAAAGAKAMQLGHDEAPVTFIEKSAVSAAFQKGAPLLETDRFKVHASRRETAGQVEVHERDTDIIYVLEGSSTFVTGGKIVEPRITGPDEVRGSSIEGGATRRIEKGDVIVVPAGTPHWFKELDGPITYYVVKAS